MKKARGKANGNGSPTVTDRQIVQALRAKGLSGDVISEILNVNKNTLRARHALALHIGRAKLRQQKAEAGELTFAEMCAADAILSAINSDWHTPDGNLIWSGLDGDGAKSAADAFAAWQRNGSRFITAGIRKKFTPQRVAEFVALKIEAQKLLGNGG
jgi:hypothetical protein